MVGLNHVGKDEILRRVRACRDRDMSDELTRESDIKSNNKASQVRALKDKLEIERLERDNNNDYFNELLKD